MKEQIEKFIKDNGLTFEKGTRNTDLVIICGYSQYLESLGRTNIVNILEEVLKGYFEKDPELYSEFNRVWNFTNLKNYYKWWTIDINRARYKM
jgi:hypothetical protein